MNPNADILSHSVCDICESRRGTLYVFYDVIKKKKIVAGQDWIICQACMRHYSKEIKLNKIWLTTRIIK